MGDDLWLYCYDFSFLLFCVLSGSAHVAFQPYGGDASGGHSDFQDSRLYLSVFTNLCDLQFPVPGDGKWPLQPDCYHRQTACGSDSAGLLSCTVWKHGSYLVLLAYIRSMLDPDQRVLSYENIS